MTTTLATRQEHDWRIVAPWYRWSRVDGAEPARALEADRPVLHKYVNTEFATDFLRDPQHTVVFDPDIDVLQQITAIPADQLIGPGGKQKWISSTRIGPDPSGTRKLFLAAHQRFYVVAFGLHCERAGFPRVDPTNVAEAGFVIRRRRVEVPPKLVLDASKLVQELQVARAEAQVRIGLDTALARSRVLHPFRSTEARVVSPRAASVRAGQEVELARRRLRTWASANALEHRSEGWVATGEGSFGAWNVLPDRTEELVERVYPMRLLRPSPDDPDHAAHDGTIYFAVVPTSSDEITDRGTNRFNELDTYEIRAYVRADHGDCPGPLVWSEPSRPFRLASFYDPQGCSQRPLEIRLPNFKELEASDAMPSVKMSAPPGSSLEFSKTGDTPTKGRAGAEEICFFSIPLITIIAFFVLNLFLPVVLFIFQLWWMLKLKFCIPPSISFEADLAVALDVAPPELQLQAGIDVDVLPGTDPAKLAAALKGIFDPPSDAGLDSVPSKFQLGSRLLGGPFTNNALTQVALRNGYGNSADAAPTYSRTLTYTTRVRRDQVVHP